MKSASVRQNRVADLIRHELATLIIHHIKDPRVGGMITVMQVEVTPDLKLARVYVSILKDEAHPDPNAVLKGLKNASGFLKSQIGKKLKLRHTPNLQFRLDTTLDDTYRLDGLLKETKH